MNFLIFSNVLSEDSSHLIPVNPSSEDPLNKSVCFRSLLTFIKRMNFPH